MYYTLKSNILSISQKRVNTQPVVHNVECGSRLFFRCYFKLLYKKIKSTLVQALWLCTGHTAHGENRGIALLFLVHGTGRGEGSASHPGRPLRPGKTRYPLYRRLGGPQGRSGQVRKTSPPTGIRSPDRPARSQSLYRLSYQAHKH